MVNASFGASQSIVALNKAYAAKIGGGTIASAAEMHLLDNGAVAVFDDRNNLIAAAVILADVADVKNFYIAVGMPLAAQGPRKTVPIPRANARTVYTTYKAPVAQVSKFGKIATVGTTGFPTTPLDGTRATAVITDTSTGDIRPNRTIRIEVPVYSTDNLGLVGARLRDAINAHTEASALLTALYTTGASDDFFTFTGTSGEVTFEVGFDDVFANITRWAYDTQSQRGAFAGFGTNAQIVRLISETNIAEGEQFRTEMRLGANGNGWWGVTDPVNGASGLTFNVVTLEWDSTSQVSVAQNHIGHPVVYVPLVVGGAGNAAILDILTVLTTFTAAASGDLYAEDSAIASGFAY